MGFIIRRAKTKRDVVGMLDVIAKTWADTYQNEKRGLTEKMILGHFKSKHTPAYYKKRYDDLKVKTRRNWIALDKNKVIGWIGCMKEKKEVSFGVYVLPQYQNQGIGKRLTELALKFLSSEKQLEIGVMYNNKVAINLYKKLGFRFNGKREDFVTIKDFKGKKWIKKMVKTK